MAQAQLRTILRHTLLDAVDQVFRRKECSLADLLAPPSLVIGEDYLALDGQYVRVLAVADLPPFVAAGWLSGVLAEKLAVDVSLHVRPLDAGAAAGGLKL